MKQIEILRTMQEDGYNVVNCGHCGSVILLYNIKDSDIKCPYCGYKDNQCSFPDLVY
jgi:DNA-directed RNA polymerase subunit RPC12/RpoP